MVYMAEHGIGGIIYTLILTEDELTNDTIMAARGHFVNKLLVPSTKKSEAANFGKNIRGMYVGALMRGQIIIYDIFRTNPKINNIL